MLSKFEREMAWHMLGELERSQLRVVLVESLPEHQPTERRRRVAVEQNPQWYSELCNAYPVNRARPRQRKKPDTAISRKCVKNALVYLACGVSPDRSVYCERLASVVKSEAEKLASHYGIASLW